MSQYTKTPLWKHQALALDEYEAEHQMLCGWEMGTGKTLFAIARDMQMREQEAITKTLVVAPLSTHKQWATAFRNEADLKVSVIDPKNRSVFLDSSADVHVMHYEALRLMDLELKAFKFHHGIFDECHRLKNRNTKQTKSAKKLKIPYLTDMSGSPVTDRPQDIWSILHHLKPKEYSSYWKFFHTFTDSERPWNGGRQAHYWVTKGPSEAWITDGLPAIQPFFSRILIDECMDIPDLNSIKLTVDMTPSMRKNYDSMRREMIAWINEIDGDDEVPLAAPVVIAKFTRMQQLAMATIELNPDTDKYRMVMPAPKIAAAADLIADNDGDKFLVFSQWRAPLVLLRQELAKRKPSIESTMFTGNETGPLREASKHQFIKGDARALLATIGAGGEGVDGLQAVSNNVIFLDRSWTPTANDQAIARLRRGGQSKPVNVIDIQSANSIDIERYERIELKKQWVMQTLGDI